MSGRGLGFSGGTLDKLESIPGYRVDLTTDEFKQQLKEKGIVLTGQSLDLAPADGKMYALRDVTGTVPSMPLIASSIMCKKIAAGAQAIVLDVKTGLGAFMETLEEARELAEPDGGYRQLAGREMVALLSDMNQPLGYAVGNSLEVIEAIETLRGHGPTGFSRALPARQRAHAGAWENAQRTWTKAAPWRKNPLQMAPPLRNSACWSRRRAAMSRMWMTRPSFRSAELCRGGEGSSKRIPFPGPGEKRGRGVGGAGSRSRPKSAIPLIMRSVSSSIKKLGIKSKKASRCSRSMPMTQEKLAEARSSAFCACL